MVRRLIAELVGTAILCTFGIGAAVAVSASAAGGPGLLIVALAHGLALAIAIYAFGSVSGGHFNPTVTIALAVRGRCAWRAVPGYVAAQLLGGVLAATLIYSTYADTAIGAGLGATTYEVSFGQAMLAEAIGAFILVTAVFALAVSTDTPRGVHGFGIGLALAAQIMVFGPLTGASVNLARTLGPDVILSATGHTAAWSQLPVYLIGPILGGLVAAFLHGILTRRASTAAAAAARG